MKNSIASPAPRSCTSCQVCYAVCPTAAITIELDEDGFYRPMVAEDACISCGKCRSVCYKFDDSVVISDSHQKAWACKGDPSLLPGVTSGGIAYLLANAAVEQGYQVAGIVYDTATDTAQAALSSDNTAQFKGSKYIQAYTAEVFKEVLATAKEQKYIVFGLPCQIYAIAQAATPAMRENLILVDLFCHGCPSLLLWKKSVAEAKKALGCDRFRSVEFRSKKKGWHEFCLHFEGENGKHLLRDEFALFYRFFFDNIVLNGACSDCSLRSTLHYTDIRLGDFWGYEYDTDLTGVSAVAAATEKGVSLMSTLPDSVFLGEHPLRNMVICQSYGKQYTVNEKRRERALSLLKSDMDAPAILRAYSADLSSKAKVKILIKKCMNLLPVSVKAKLRKTMHGRGRK